MSTDLQKQPIDDVGDCDRPRTRPRGGTLCVGVPKGGPPTTSTSPTTENTIAHVQSPTSADLKTLAELNRELERAINAEFASQPY